jgi:SAM-dependent methyltransferase
VRRGDIRRFYDAADEERWGRSALPERDLIEDLVARHLRPEDWLLELGCGRGALEGIHPRYVGLDVSHRVLREYFSSSTLRVQADMEQLPFRAGTVRMIVTLAALEHVPCPERCLEEIDRVLRPGGVLFLAPAWFCRPWAARGLHVRSFRELGWRDRLEKLTIPFREHILFRAGSLFPRRLLHEIEWRVRRGPFPFRYRRLKPNLDEYITSDSDAFTSMDPHTAILFFLSLDYEILSAPSAWRRFCVRHEPVVVRKAPGSDRRTT